MSFEVIITAHFSRKLKTIKKKHPAIKNAVVELIEELSIDPEIGVHLGSNLYKIRIAIPGTNKGKSGGARVITYVIFDDKTAYLTDIYLKSEHDSVDISKLIQRLKDQGII